MVRQQRAIETRARLVAVAAHEFVHRGYAGASVAVIAAVADCSKGAMHFHFKSKRDVAVAVLDDAAAVYERLVEPHLARTDTNPFVALKTMIIDLAEPMIRRDVVRAEATLVLEPGRGVDRPSLVWEEAVETLLSRAEQAGWLAPGYTADSAARLLIAMMTGMRSLHTAAPRADVQPCELFADVVDVIDTVLDVRR
jgi:AcrR family transcriptional regulator